MQKEMRLAYDRSGGLVYSNLIYSKKFPIAFSSAFHLQYFQRVYILSHDEHKALAAKSEHIVPFLNIKLYLFRLGNQYKRYKMSMWL